MPTPLALSVEIKPSNYFRIALAGVTAAALAAIGYSALPWPVQLLLGIIALTYGVYCWRMQMRQRGVLQWRSQWIWRGAEGVERRLRLRHSTVWPGLIVLNFSDVEGRDAQRKRNFVLTLFADSFERSGLDDARRLRVHLHHFPVFDTDHVAD